MKRDKTVTVWHFVDESEEVERKVFRSCHIRIIRKLSKNGIKQKGFYMGNSADVRIFTLEDIATAPGDYLSDGEVYSVYPDVETSLKIIEVRDNRRGTQPHWRILCGG